MPLNVGRLDRRINIIARANTLDSAGQPTETETTRYENIPAMILTVRAEEKFNFNRDMATKVNTFRIRYREGILSTDMIQYNNDKYAIRGITPKGTRNREYIDILGEAFETPGI